MDANPIKFFSQPEHSRREFCYIVSCAVESEVMAKADDGSVTLKQIGENQYAITAADS